MNDKTQHFIAGFLLSILGLAWTPLILLGFMFGIGKEAYDPESLSRSTLLIETPFFHF